MNCRSMLLVRCMKTLPLSCGRPWTGLRLGLGQDAQGLHDYSQSAALSVEQRLRWMRCCSSSLQTLMRRSCVGSSSHSAHHVRCLCRTAGDTDAVRHERGGTRESYLEARQRGILKGRRKLSPLDRVSGMLNSQEGTHEAGMKPLVGDQLPSNDGQLLSEAQSTADREKGPISGTPASHLPTRHRGPPLVDGEYILVSRENLKRQEKMVRLVKLDANLEFKCKFGSLSHADIVGHQSGSIFLTNMGIELLIVRPSLEDYVIYMKRMPVIAYPKDACTMLMMIDASPGDVILEAGSGSGAMTLFLSRAVGHFGHIFSFDKMDTHQTRARKNFEMWQKSWDISHSVKWPQNVSFIPARLEGCHKYIDDNQVDGAIIDLERPASVMPIVAAKLKPGKAVAVYIANLTQVIDLAEAIRRERLPLVLETTLEVAHKAWVVNPARRHSGPILGEPRIVDGKELDTEGEVYEGMQFVADEVPKYLARPHHMQQSHSAFLARIRKIQSPSSSTTFKV